MKDWIDEWYSDLERNLTKYKRPDDWRERFEKAQERIRKPVRNQFEGKRSAHHEDN